MIFVLLFMLVLGPVQVIWAFISMLTTNYPKVKQHMQYYLLGVLIYFSTLFLGGLIVDALPNNAISQIIYALGVFFFFAGAWGLAIYQVLIVAWKGEFRKNDNEQPFNFDPEV